MMSVCRYKELTLTLLVLVERFSGSAILFFKDKLSSTFSKSWFMRKGTLFLALVIPILLVAAGAYSGASWALIPVDRGHRFRNHCPRWFRNRCPPSPEYAAGCTKEEFLSAGSVQIKKTTVDSEVNDWNIYRDKNAHFEFKYPKILTLTQKANQIVLNHSIPYKNNGPCDLISQGGGYDTLTDFAMSIELVPQAVNPEYIDGPYRVGSLEGSWVYEGTEGCGHTTFYFPVAGSTLVIRKDVVQALSGISTAWNREEILKVPGVIRPEESEVIFNEILSTFRFGKDSP